MIKPYVQRGSNLPDTVNRGGIVGGCCYIDEAENDAADPTFADNYGFPTQAPFGKSGPILLRRVLKTDAVAWARGTCCMTASGTGGYDDVVLSTGNFTASRFAGIAVRAVEQNEFDHIVFCGDVQCLVGAAIAVDAPVVMAAGGIVKAMAAGEEHMVIGHTMEAAALAGLVRVRLKNPA